MQRDANVAHNASLLNIKSLISALSCLHGLIGSRMAVVSACVVPSATSGHDCFIASLKTPASCHPIHHTAQHIADCLIHC